MLIIAAVRVAGSLPVLRWAFFGALLAVLVDFSDLFLKNLIDLGGVGDYQAFDKYLDLVYMATFAIVAVRWSDPERAVLFALLGFRLIGVTLFGLTGERSLLPFFPNLFEFFFIFVAAQRHYFASYVLTARRIALCLAALLIPKLFQEYALHEARWLDDYSATEVVADAWQALTGWLY